MQKLIYLPLLQNAQENEQNCVDALRCFHHKSCTHPCHPRRSRPMSWENCPLYQKKSLILLASFFPFAYFKFATHNIIFKGFFRKKRTTIIIYSTDKSNISS